MLDTKVAQILYSVASW